MRALAVALLLAGCKAPPPAPPAKSCVDRELERRGLNAFGDPPDTVYAGGSPLFDEKSGKSTDREFYVFSRHPEIARACRPH